MTTLEAMLLISVLTTIVLMVVSFLIYSTNTEKRFWHVTEYWFFFLCFTIASTYAQATGKEKIIGLPIVIFGLYIRCVLSISSDLCRKELKRNWYNPVMLTGFVAGAFLAAFDAPFWAYTLTGILGFTLVAYNIVYDCWNEMRKNKKVITLHYLYLFNIVLQMSHMLDFPFLRLDADYAPIGFGIAVALTLLMAITLPGLMIHELQDERSRILEVVLQERNLQLEKQFKMSSLGEMTATLVHELGNPLTFLSGRNSILMRKVENDQINKPELVLGLNQMQQTIQRMVTITKSLRCFSRDSELESKNVVQLQELVNETLSFISDRFLENNLPLVIGKIPNVNVECKSVQISQVLVNLLNNAYDAIQSHPNPWVRVDFEETSYSIKIMIIDSGKGIPGDIQNKIMLPFFTTKEVGKGTGLGLSISQQIVTEHRGKLFLDENNLNTTFILELPVS